MNSSILNNKQRYAVIVLSVMLSLMVVWGAVQGATTISSNISTGGTLSVTSTSALTGLTTMTAGYISGASSTVIGALSITGAFTASSSATSTAANGFNLINGCFSIAGTCIGLATSSTAANTWSALQTFTAGVLSTASSTFSGQTMFSAPLQASSTLLVTGLSNLTGFISSASSTVAGTLAVNGQLQASSTLLANGLATLTGGFVSAASSTVSSDLHVSGALNASTTLTVAGVTTHYGDLNVNGYATTTASNGNFASAGNIVASSTTSTLKGVGVATSTPAAEFAANGSATTTLYMTTTKAITGGCIELMATNGTMYRMYIGAMDSTAIATTTVRSGTLAQFFAVWEAGSCK